MFLIFYEFIHLPPSPTSSNSISSNPKPRRINHPCSSQFRSLVFRGETKLSYYSNLILIDLLGEDNRTLCQSVHVHWTLNEASQDLALLYRLNKYIGWSSKSPRKIHRAVKFWADGWKAWWGCCFWEREVWGDDVKDLLSCLRRIMALRYRGLVQRYSTNRRVNRGGSSKHDRMNIVGETPAREVRREDATICEWLGPPSGDNKKIFLDI